MLTRNDIIRLLKEADFEEIEITCPDGAICMAPRAAARHTLNISLPDAFICIPIYVPYGRSSV